MIMRDNKLPPLCAVIVNDKFDSKAKLISYPLRFSPSSFFQVADERSFVIGKERSNAEFRIRKLVIVDKF
jgi:hypothetical protein